jgi:hypothetical protein
MLKSLSKRLFSFSGRHCGKTLARIHESKNTGTSGLFLSRHNTGVPGFNGPQNMRLMRL